ncbi:MAG: hypothetical protein GEU91_11660 [Rhizobiales bacterium]|nr:hypothetical protein [Hyphomicrobiales bacterium]
MSGRRLRVICSCGAVEFEAVGKPIVTAVCYCDDCQAAARQIEAMPGAASFRQSDGGTLLVVYRKDRVRCVRGEALLAKMKLRNDSATNRTLATCCNSAITLDFDDSKHWVDIYGAPVQSIAMMPEMLVCTRFAPDIPTNPDRKPAHPGYPPRFVLKLLAARAAMLFSR